MPKGRLFATTRDDLLEQAALIRKMRAGELDMLEVPPQPADVLMQQIVAACGAESWDVDSLYNIVRRAYSYRDLTKVQFDELIAILSNGIESSRGRYGAYLMHDRIQGQLHPRRGARMIAIANGGAIPDTALSASSCNGGRADCYARRTLCRRLYTGRRHSSGNTSWRVSE